MAIRQVLAVLSSLAIGTGLGSIGHATEAKDPVRTCEEVSEDEMRCDDGTTCFLIDGIWVCEPTSPVFNR